MAAKENWFEKHRVPTVILVLVVLSVVVGAVDGGNKPGNNTTASSTVANKAKPAATTESKPKVPAEYKSALYQADSYANDQNLSKQAVYDQLVSQYGGKFSVAAAKYAIGNVKADWNANALAKAKDYQDNEHLSPAEIHDQLTSQYGEKFTQAQADYAIQHLND